MARGVNTRMLTPRSYHKTVNETEEVSVNRCLSLMVTSLMLLASVLTPSPVMILYPDDEDDDMAEYLGGGWIHNGGW